MGMTMMMMDADDDEGWGCYPFTRSDLDMWCQVEAEVTPLPLARLGPRGSPRKIRPAKAGRG